MRRKPLVFYSHWTRFLIFCVVQSKAFKIIGFYWWLNGHLPDGFAGIEHRGLECILWKSREVQFGTYFDAIRCHFHRAALLSLQR